jgi:hypothetical protein
MHKKNGNNDENNNRIQNNNKTIRITILKRSMTSGLNVGKQGRQTHGRTHNMFFAHTTG